MRIWKQDISLAALQATGANTAVSQAASDKAVVR